MPWMVAIAVAATLAVLTVAITGFQFPSGNNVFHVAIVEEYGALPWLADDSFVATLDAFVSGFWQMARLMRGITSTETLFFILHLVSRFLVLLSAIFAGWTLAGSTPRVTLLTATALCLPLFLGATPTGGQDLLGSSLSHSAVALAPMLLALGLGWSGRWVTASLCLGITALLNFFIGASTLVILGLASSAERVHRPPHPSRAVSIGDLGRLAAMPLAFTIGALPVVYWIARTLLEPAPSADPFDYRLYLRTYFPGHTFLAGQETAYFRTLAMCAAASLWVWSCRDRMPHPERWHRALLVLAAFGFWTVIAGVWPIATDSRLLLNLFPLRVAGLGVVAVAVVLAAMAAAEGSRLTARQVAAASLGLVALADYNIALFLLGIMVAVHSPPIRLLAAGLIVVDAGVTHAFGTGDSLVWSQPRLVVAIAVQALTLGLAARHLTLFEVAAAAIVMINGMLRSEADLAFVSQVVAAVAVFLAQWRDLDVRGALGAAVAAALGAAALCSVLGVEGLTFVALSVVVLAVAALAWVASVRWRDRVVPWPSPWVGIPIVVVLLMVPAAGLVSRDGWIRLSPDRVACVDLQRWAARSTPRDSLWLSPDCFGFMTLSERSVWYDWKIGGAVMWSPSFHATWDGRRIAVEGARTTADLIDLAWRECVDYVVVSTGRASGPLTSEPVQQMGDLRVYEAPACDRKQDDPQPSSGQGAASEP